MTREFGNSFCQTLQHPQKTPRSTRSFSTGNDCRFMSRRLLAIALALFVAAAMPLAAGHEIESNDEEPNAAEPHAWMLGDWGGLRSRLEERGISLEIDYTAEIFGNPVGGRRRASAYEGEADLGPEIDLAKL